MVRASVADVDAVLLVVEPGRPMWASRRWQLIERIKALKLPAVLVINKIDTLENKEELLEVIAAYSAVSTTLNAIMPISAKDGGRGGGAAGGAEAQFLPGGPPALSGGHDHRPAGAAGHAPRSCGRSCCYCLDKEIPHGTAVEITRFSERDDSEIIDVDATIFCEKASHKGIIIGKGGAMLKKISTMARQDMEHFMGTKVFLQTWVKVKENWRDSLAGVHNMGYNDED